MTNKNPDSEPIHPRNYNDDTLFFGLTKRELFAAVALQGLLTNHHKLPCASYEDFSEDAVRHADALIAELGKAK